MDKIKTKRSERRLSRDLIEEGLRLVAERSEREGVNKDTAKRHASAIRGVIPALGVVKSKVVKPGFGFRFIPAAMLHRPSSAI